MKHRAARAKPGWRRSRSLLHAAACALAIFSPVATTILLVHLVHGASLSDFAPPAHTNDETAYWHQTASFAHHGFDIGLYATDEEEAPLRFSRFGAYGPWFPMLYGTIGRVTGGWHLYSGPFVHLLVISLAVVTLLLLARPTTRQVLLLAAFLATFWPMAFFIQTNMQEGLHYAIGIVAAGLFYKLAHPPASASLRFIALSVLFIVFAAMIRITWLVLLIPFLLCSLGRLSIRRVTIVTAGALVIGALAAMLSGAFSSQHSLITISLSNFSSVGFNGTAEILLERFARNLPNLFLFEGQQPLAILQRHQYMLLLAGLGITALINRRERHFHTLVFHGFNLLGILVLTLFAYLVSVFADYRLFSVHLLVCVTYLAVRGRSSASIIVGLLLASNILIGPLFVTTYRQAWDYVYSGSLRAKILEFEHTVVKHVEYQQGADFWCNTITLWYEPHVGYPAELAGVPPGIGINVRFAREDPPVPPSRYLLASFERLESMKERVELRRLATLTSSGQALILVENPDAPCDRRDAATATGGEPVSGDAFPDGADEQAEVYARGTDLAGPVGSAGLRGARPVAASCLDLRNAGVTTDGAYGITVGESELQVFCDMTTNGGGWTLLLDQDVAEGYEPSTVWASGVNADEPTAGHYSILHFTDHFEGSSPGFQFLIDWPNDGSDFVRWEQSENPLRGAGTVSNIVESPPNQRGCSTFAGLRPGISTLHGSIGGCEWWAIGTSAPYSGGFIPAYEFSDEGPLFATRARLWVRAAPWQIGSSDD